MRFGKDLERRRLRLHFLDGQVWDGFIVDVAGPEDGDGFVFDWLTNSVPVKEKTPGVWARFADLENYEVLEN